MTIKDALSNIKKNWCILATGLLVVASAILLLDAYYMIKHVNGRLDEIEYTDTAGQYNKIYYEKQFKALKKENKQLYDSLKVYKDKIDYLVQFTYTNEHSTGVVTTKPGSNLSQEEKEKAKTYEYQGEQGDTFSYKLTLNSFCEPNWFKIDTKVKETFTIVNKKEGDMSHITIGAGGNGTISDVTAFKQKEKKKLKDYVAIGPSVSAGYDPIRKDFGVLVGVSATIDLW